LKLAGTAKRALTYAGVVLVALALGAGSALLALTLATSIVLVENEEWSTNPLAGSTEANPYSRAYTSLGSLLALNREEAIYYTAEEDAEGETLTSACDYTVRGGSFAAGWWSLTAYGGDHFLIPNEQDRYSYSQSELQSGGEERWSIRLSAEPQEGNWLPTGNANKVVLFLRLYNPEPSVHENLGTVELPEISRESCR
jgi:hypothetical protein